MRFLVGSDYARDPNAGAAGTIVWTNQALRDLGHEVDEFWGADLRRRIRHGNLHYLVELPSAFRREVAARCRRRAYDAVILDQPHAFLAGEYLQARYPEVLFLNRTQGWEGQADEALRALKLAAPPWLRGLAQGAMRRLLARHQDRVVACADGILAGCSPVPDYLERKYGYPRERVAVIPYGVTDEFIRRAPSTEPGRWRRILHVAQFAPFKAPEIVAAVFSRVLRERPDVQAGWICDPRHHGQVRELFAPELRERLQLHPWADQRELVSRYDAYGIFLFPSHYEGFGKTPFEAMARGLAVVATRVGGLGDLVRDGENGLLCAPGDAEGLCRRVAQLLDDPARAAQLGAQARRDAAALTWPNHARALVDFTVRRQAEKRARAGAIGGFVPKERLPAEAAARTAADVSVVVPTYRRGAALLDTLGHLLAVEPPPAEILVVDQTETHPPAVTEELRRLETAGRIRIFRFAPPSIPRAMNVGLRAAKRPVVLYVDDDVVPARDLVAAHAARYSDGFAAVCGQVLQPGEEPDPTANRGPRGTGFGADLDFRFNATRATEVASVISCNLSVDRAAALSIGGFDEGFIGSAYRYETDFARRLLAAGHRIRFAPEATLRHLRLPTGGTRSCGDHLERPSPLHSFGDYYFALRHARGRERWIYVARRMVQETANRYYGRHPGKLPRKVWSEIRALAMAWRRIGKRGGGLMSAVRQPQAFYEAQYSAGRYAAYASAEAHPFRRTLAALIARYGDARGSWLEVGCGRGYLQDVVADYVGVDLAASAARFLRKPFQCAPAERLPFPENRFAGIWSYAVLEHVEDPERALAEMRRVLKPGGILILAPAWQCRPWAGKDYAWKPYRELPWPDRIRKAALPIRDSVAFRSLFVFPARLARLASLACRRAPTTFRSRRLEPNYAEYRLADADARHGMDPFEAILWFRSRGDGVLEPAGGLRALLVRAGALVVEIRKEEAGGRVDA
ncbi:MAG: glycosyltransferase [Kiritimatiellia bacterium]